MWTNERRIYFNDFAETPVHPAEMDLDGMVEEERRAEPVGVNYEDRQILSTNASPTQQSSLGTTISNDETTMTNPVINEQTAALSLDIPAQSAITTLGAEALTVTTTSVANGPTFTTYS
eukprot:gene16492-18132_t